MSNKIYNINPIPEIAENELPICLHDREIVLFGFGVNGKSMLELALALGYTIVEIWDNNLQIQQYEGIKVCKPHNKLNKSTPIMITVVMRKIAADLYQQAKSWGYFNILNYTTLFLHDKVPSEVYKKMCYQIQQYRLVTLYSKSEKSVSINSIDFQITDKCSLRCKECANLMQYFTQPKDFDFDECIADIDKLLSVVDYILDVRVIGGEPFVCKDFHRYIERLLTYKNIGMISIYTNGTIIPTSKNIECLKSDKVILKISNYGQLSRNLNNLINVCKKEQILYDIAQIEYWTKCATFEQHHRTDNENRAILKNCCVGSCPSMRNHRIFRCPFLANAWALKAIPQNIIEYVDLNTSDIETLKNDIQSYFDKDLILGCDYCLGRPIDFQNQVRVPVAEQIKNPIGYKQYYGMENI